MWHSATARHQTLYKPVIDMISCHVRIIARWRVQTKKNSCFRVWHLTFVITVHYSAWGKGPKIPSTWYLSVNLSLKGRERARGAGTACYRWAGGRRARPRSRVCPAWAAWTWPGCPWASPHPAPTPGASDWSNCLWRLSPESEMSEPASWSRLSHFSVKCCSHQAI